jgi:PBP1b-binding outer membrane lipoprotein LpoB
MKTTPIFLFSILLLGACSGPAARAKRPGAKAQAAAAVQPSEMPASIQALRPGSTSPEEASRAPVL